jgi:large subunit ribosomal protein L10
LRAAVADAALLADAVKPLGDPPSTPWTQVSGSHRLSLVAVVGEAGLLQPGRDFLGRDMFGVGMDRSQKADLVGELKQVFSETSVVVITRNLGLTVAQSTDLRLRMRDAGAQFKVAKNRLALIALDGTRYQPISEMLSGPTALATSVDPVAAAKVAVDFAKTTDKFEIVGGAMGDTVLDLAGIRALAALPSLDELRATLIGTIQAPASKIARTVAEPGAQLARVFGAYAVKDAA